MYYQIQLCDLSCSAFNFNDVIQEKFLFSFERIPSRFLYCIVIGDTNRDSGFTVS